MAKQMNGMMYCPDYETPLRVKYCAPMTRVVDIRCDGSFLVSSSFDGDIEPTDEDDLF